MSGEPLDQATYNANVQRVQREATDWGFEHRVRPQYSKPERWEKKNPRLSAATFEVFWDRWQLIGTQIDPMTPEARYRWDEEAWAKINHQAARALAS
jgi:hypothetical protein